MAKVTILNSMAGRDFQQALDTHVLWGLELLDLKDAIFGKGIAELTEEEAKRVSALAGERKLSVYCLSTGLFHGEVELGEGRFRRDYLDKLAHVIKLANILKPKMIRLLSAQTSKRGEIKDSIKYMRANYPWLIPLYAEAIDLIASAGFEATIENEVGGCIFSTPEEIIAFFEELKEELATEFHRRTQKGQSTINCATTDYKKVCFTWDVQNLWQMGIYPTMGVYNKLKGLIGYYHLKGGQHSNESNQLCWRSSLEDASWPVVEITRQVVIDGVSPVICLNPSHGRPKEGYDYSNITKRDLDFIRKSIPEIE